MTVAICIHCGNWKFGAVNACKKCDYAPAGELELAYSVALSDHYFDTNTLEQISVEMQETGRRPKLPLEQEEKFVRAVSQDANMQHFLRLNAISNEAAAAKARLPAEDFEQISRLPHFVFIAVAGADGKIDGKELAAFTDVLNLPVCARAFKSLLFKALVMFGENTLHGQSATNSTSPPRFESDYASSAASIVYRHCVEGEFSTFADDVQSLAFIVASASGGIFGLGSKISRAEREVIARLKEAFSVSKTRHSAQTEADFALSWFDGFIGLFKDEFQLDPDGSEIGVYVVSMLDFCLQSRADEDTYKSGISAVMRAVSVHAQVAPDALAHLVQKRAPGYVKLTNDVVGAKRRRGASESISPEVQLAWEFYSHAAHRDPRGHMIGLLAVLAPVMLEFVLAADKFATLSRS